MADAFIGTSQVSNLIKTAYDRYVEFGLRSQPLVRSIVDKHPVQQAMPGSSVVLSLYSDMTPVASTLSELVDPDSVAIANPTTVTVTLGEYGNVTKATKLAKMFAFSELDPAILNQVAWNMVDSLDILALNTLRQGTNVVYAGASGAVDLTGPTSAVTAAKTISGKQVRFVVAKLRGGNAIPRKDGLYWAGIHPDVSVDLRTETGSTGWRVPHEYGANQNIWTGEIGSFEGAYFVETNRMYSATDGASSAKVHRTLFAGQQVLAEAVAEEPHLEIGPSLDKLNRFTHIGWKGTLGWARYREAALYRLESGCSI